MESTFVASKNKKEPNYYIEPQDITIAADPIIAYMTKPQMEKNLKETKSQMEKAAKNMDFMEAARLRDEMYALQKLLQEKFGSH